MHFILKNLILKSNNNLTFFLKHLRKTISSRMITSYQTMCVGPSLVVSLEPLVHQRNVASLSLFYSYYFGRCSSKLPQLVSLPHSCGSSSRYSNNRLHDFFFTIPRFYKDFYVNSFFPRTAKLWNSLPAERFPLTSDINCFKSRVKFIWLYLLNLFDFVSLREILCIIHELNPKSGSDYKKPKPYFCHQNKWTKVERTYKNWIIQLRPS